MSFHDIVLDLLNLVAFSDFEMQARFNRFSYIDRNKQRSSMSIKSIMVQTFLKNQNNPYYGNYPDFEGY